MLRGLEQRVPTGPAGHGWRRMAGNTCSSAAAPPSPTTGRVFAGRPRPGGRSLRGTHGPLFLGHGAEIQLGPWCDAAGLWAWAASGTEEPPAWVRMGMGQTQRPVAELHVPAVGQAPRGLARSLAVAWHVPEAFWLPKALADTHLVLSQSSAGWLRSCRNLERHLSCGLVLGSSSKHSLVFSFRLHSAFYH